MSKIGKDIHRFSVMSSIQRLPGRLGREKLCFCSCLGLNSSSSVETVISEGLVTSNYIMPQPHNFHEEASKLLPF